MTTDKEAVRVDAWQPIETAPTDGTPVLLFYSGLMYVAQWETDSVFGPVWCTVDATTLFNPTHWMPLPVPPATQGGEGERT